ncbi:amidase family protein [Colletotrichum plurivorum]|uniref:Amidase family protein n=1 Tax=Colletotrichum plurivorum TaxID=2175906 RepID=A0A8H6K416_9PEZI|nr:amidase family protein [Colletotrichum plurivorum]
MQLYRFAALAPLVSSTSWPWPANATQAVLPSMFPLLEDAGTENLFPMPRCGGFELHEATIDEMQAAMEAGVLTSVQLVACYLRRTYQTQEYLHSLLQANPDVLHIAAQMDAERAAGHIRGPLHGIPFTVKDNIATRDSTETTAGSWALLGSIVPRDAHVVAKLRAAGAVLLGKAAMSEWADMRSNNYSEGYSARGGQCRSPYNLVLNPGGSSSGSAAGVAANTVAFSLGTETSGSVIDPAARNAVVGLKPTVGLTSRAGVIPESENYDSVGTFGRTFKDAAYALDAIYGIDGRDNYTLAQEGRTPEGGYAQFLSTKELLKDASFGLPWKSFWVHADDDQRQILEGTLKLLESAGATIVNNTEITNYETIVSQTGWNWDHGGARGFPNESEYTVIKVDFYNNINTYLSELGNTNIKTIEDIVQYNYDNDGTEGGNPWPLGHPAFYSGQDGFIATLETKGEKDETYYQALEFTQRTAREGINNALTSADGTKMSGLLVPANVGQSYQTAAQAGYPMAAVPVGIHQKTGMGVALGLVQTAYGEAELVRWGSAVEDLLRGTEYKRALPRWYNHLERNIPVS